MIMERLAFGVPPGCGKALCEHLLHELQMWLLVKGCVKAQHRPGSLQVVATELQLCHCMYCTQEFEMSTSGCVLHLLHYGSQHLYTMHTAEAFVAEASKLTMSVQCLCYLSLSSMHWVYML